MTAVSDPSALRIAQLEAELEEMTGALSQAWDQLVPFLQHTSQPARSVEDIQPLLLSIMAALDVDIAAIFEFQNDQWFAIPEDVRQPEGFIEHLEARIRGIEELRPYAFTAGYRRKTPLEWLVMPLITEGVAAGAIAVAVPRGTRAFTALESRILERMTERAASQIQAAALADSREREAIAARELKIASHIQASIQPLHLPRLPSIDLAVDWHPAKSVGGDAWGWVLQPSGRLALFVLDVAGKGLPAALAAVSLHAAVQMALRLDFPPHRIMETLNEAFYEPFTRTDLIATGSILAYDPLTRTLEQANAGHPATLIRTTTGWMTWEAEAPPIGMLPRMELPCQEFLVQTGDLMLFFSDGLTEAETAEGFYGEARVMASVPQGDADASCVLTAVLDAVDQFRGDHEPQDDQTILVARSEERSTMPDLTMEFPAREDSIPILSTSLEQLLPHCSVEMRQELELAVHELCVNIIKHAYAGQPGDIMIGFHVDTATVTITVRDGADKHFDWPPDVTLPDPLSLPEGGWGMPLIYHAVDSVHYEALEHGNRWELVRTLES